MRLTTVFIMASLLQVSAATFGQKISLDKKNVPLETLFREIRKQSGYNFYFDGQIITPDLKGSISVSNASIDQALKALLTDKKLSYEIRDRLVIITQNKTPSFLDNLIARFAAIDVRGKVVSSETGQALAGATIKVKGASKSVNTDANGDFYLPGIDEKAMILISYVGYRQVELPAAKEMGMIKLEMMSGDLQEVTINKGYYTVSKELNTGSVGVIKAADIAKQPVSDPMMALVGRIPGLFIAQNSGVPGAGFSVQLRGRNSIANNNNPFYIVDGVPFVSSGLSQNPNAGGTYGEDSPFRNIRPEDIENIEVLKDADATAIYGSRGANGVILITTKKGKSGSSVIAVNGSSGIGNAPSKLKLMNTEQYLSMRYQALKNENLTPSDFEYDINGAYDQNRYTDWKKELIGGTARFNTLSTDISGGTTNTTFLIGGNYRDETTVFPGDYNSRIGSAKVSVNHSPEHKRFYINLSTFYVNNNLKLPLEDFSPFIFLAPNSPSIYTREGQLNWADSKFNNPFGRLEKRNSSISNTLNGRAELGLRLIESMQLKLAAGYNNMGTNETTITPFSSVDPAESPFAIYVRQLLHANHTVATWTADPQLDYFRQFRGHQISALIGGSFQDTRINRIRHSYGGFTSDLGIENPQNSAQNMNYIDIGSSKYRYNAVYGRLGYTYNTKYTLNLTGRRDGSSRFGSGKQFGSFGAVGAAWIFSKEAFMKSFSFVSLAKLRTSFGTAGTDPSTDYGYMDAYQPGGQYLDGTNTLRPIRLANSEFRWETIKKLEGGLELGFMNNKLMMNFSVYRNRTVNQLVGYALPAVTGFTTIQANLPAVIENKGLELELNSTNISHKDFTWTTSFNISFDRNKLVSYQNLAGSSYANKYVIGQPLSIHFVYDYTGVDPTTGLYTFKDINNDDVMGIADKMPVKVDQDFYGGLGNSFSYKSVSLDVFFDFVKQDGFNTSFYIMPGGFTSIGLNQPLAVAGNQWQQPGDAAKFQRYTNIFDKVYQAGASFMESSGRITDASFVRLKNVNLSWTLPDKWSQKVKMQSLRLYLQGQNLFTLTKFEGLDPETQRFGNQIALPPLQVFMVGFQLRY